MTVSNHVVMNLYCTRETPLGIPLVGAQFLEFLVPRVPSFVLTGVCGMKLVYDRRPPGHGLKA